jgi:hypothetical protein
LRGLPADRVAQMHLAGHDDHGDYLIDAHGSPVAEPVWALFAEAVRLFPEVPVCVEWDRDVPSLEVLVGEMNRASGVVTEVTEVALAGQEGLSHAP